MNSNKIMKLAGVALLALLASGSEIRAQLLPPNLNYELDTWSFEDTSWVSDLGYPPVSFTNLNNPPSFDGSAVQVDSASPAWLQYNIIETDGTTNLTLNQGTIELWFLPDWNSGTGPGDWGRLIDVGTYTTNASVGWWSLYLSPDGSTLNFSSQTNEAGTNYLTCPISWDTNTWHFIALTYTHFRSDLYVDGQLATNGPGVIYLPGADVLTNGFYVGSDSAGAAQVRGLIDDMATYNYALGPNEITNDYAAGMQLISPSGGGFHMDDGDGGINPGGGTNSGGGGIYSESFNVDYGTNLWIAQFGIVSNYTTGILSNSEADVQYEILAATNLLGSWVSEGFFAGSEMTNWTPLFSIPTSLTNNLFLQVRSWADNTGTGIPDWWWLEYFGQTTNVDAFASDPAGDGYTDLQKYQMGLNPANYYTTNAVSGFVGCLDATGTNAILYWNQASGPVTGYIIQRGVYNTTNYTYAYTPIATVSSNATSYEDSGAISNNNALENSYQLMAEYPGNSLSPTDTWYLGWYTSAGSSGPPYGPPVPGNVYAGLDATGTNVLLSWTPAPGAATNYLVEHGIYNPTNYSYDFSVITNVGTNIASFSLQGAVTNEGNWSDEYGVAAVYPGGGLSALVTSAINVGFTNGAPAPGSFYGYTDSSGNNVILTWNPAVGAVTNYVIYGQYFDYDTYSWAFDQLGTVSSNTTSFEAVGTASDYWYYLVVAVYANGSQSQAASWSFGSSPPGPTALYVYLDSTGTNVQMSWSSATGAISGYPQPHPARGPPF